MAARPTVDTDEWRESLATRYFGLRAEATDRQDAPTVGNLVSLNLGDISAHTVWGNPQTLHRTSRTTRSDPCDLLKICLVVRGHTTLEQDGRSVDLGPGTFALYDTSRPYRILNHDDWQVQVLTAAREDLTVSPRRLKDLQLTSLSATEGPGLLLASYLTGLTTMSNTAAAAHAHLREASLALLNGALSQSLETVLATSTDAVAEQILRYVDANLAAHQLSV